MGSEMSVMRCFVENHADMPYRSVPQRFESLQSVSRRCCTLQGNEPEGSMGTDTCSANVPFRLIWRIPGTPEILLVGAGWLRRDGRLRGAGPHAARLPGTAAGPAVGRPGQAGAHLRADRAASRLRGRRWQLNDTCRFTTRRHVSFSCSVVSWWSMKTQVRRVVGAVGPRSTAAIRERCGRGASSSGPSMSRSRTPIRARCRSAR
jgi:hypothetical protein